MLRCTSSRSRRCLWSLVTCRVRPTLSLMGAWRCVQASAGLRRDSLRVGSQMKARMRRPVFCLVLLALPVLTVAQEQSSVELTLKLARERAYRAADVDWSTVEAETRLRAADKGEDDAIRFVLKSLGDGHSFYRPPRPAVTALPAAGSASQAPVRDVSEAQASHEGVPVIRINGWSGTHQDAMAATAALRSDLVSALSEPRCGIVLDFSGNTGGNMWPMLIGLSPLLTEGVLGYFKDARGTATVIDKRSAGISIGGSAHALNTATAQQPRHPPHWSRSPWDREVQAPARSFQSCSTARPTCVCSASRPRVTPPRTPRSRCPMAVRSTSRPRLRSTGTGGCSMHTSNRTSRPSALSRRRHGGSRVDAGVGER